MAGGCGSIDFSSRVSILREVHSCEGDVLDDRRATPAERLQRRSRLRADQQVDSLRPSFRGNRGSRAAGRPDTGGAVRLFARGAVDPLRRRAWAAQYRIS